MGPFVVWTPPPVGSAIVTNVTWIWYLVPVGGCGDRLFESRSFGAGSVSSRSLSWSLVMNGGGEAKEDGAGSLRPAVLTAAAIGIVLALVTQWPLPTRMASAMPESGPQADIGDPYLVAWQIAWEGHALRTAPGDLFDANYFYPLENSLAFLDPLHGFAPAAVIGSGADAAVVRYNLLYLLAYALAFAGCFLLARELGLGTFAAVLAGAAFAYSPWRQEQLGHLLVISSGGIPLALAMLVRGYRRARWKWVAAGWLTATWQLSLGYTLGLQFAYLLALLGVILTIRWLVVGRPPIPRAVIGATAAGFVLFGGWGLLQAIPNLEVAETYPEAVRSESEVDFYSPPPWSFLVASPNNLLRGERNAEIRATLPYPLEQSLFPGVIAISLAIWGLGYSRSPFAVRAGLWLGTLLFGYLALGFQGPQGGFLYKALFHHAPGWDAVRTPGRLMTIATLGLALLAAHGLESIVGSLRQRLAGSKLSIVPIVIAIGLAGGVVLEGWGPTRLLPVADVPESQTAVEGPVLHLPIDDGNDRIYMYWSTENFSPMVNGVAAFTPHPHSNATEAVATFPDEASVTFLRDMGVRNVIVHLDRLPDATVWEAATVPLAEALSLQVERIGPDLVFSLDP